MRIRKFEPADAQETVRLWQRCGLTRPWNDPNKDIQRKLTVQPELFLVAESDGRITGTVMAGFDGHRGWVNYLAVDPDQQGRGVATALMASAEDVLRQMGCPKVNVQIRRDNLAAAEFYDRLGYASDDVISMGKRLEPDGA